MEIEKMPPNQMVKNSNAAMAYLNRELIINSHLIQDQEEIKIISVISRHHFSRDHFENRGSMHQIIIFYVFTVCYE